MSTEQTKPPSAFRRLLFLLKLVEIRLRFVVILVLTGLIVGYWDTIQNYRERWERQRQTAAGQAHAAPKRDAGESQLEFFCPMHPFVVRDRTGSCPVCGMNLVQRTKGALVALPEGTVARVQVSPERILQAGVQIEPVAYRLLSRTVRSYGIIEPAETAMARIIARFPGRVEDLMVNAVGLVVKKGEPLVRLYSPKYLAATQEFLQALTVQRETEKDAQAGPEEKRRAVQIAQYARQRLALAGFTGAQLEAMAKTGHADEFVTLESPLAGTVLERNVLLGDMVEEGTVLYTVANLTAVWVQVQIIESELSAVKLGMPVEISSVAWPGRIFYGNVDFIYPTVSAELRSVKVRVIVDSANGDLKPGMYATAVIRSPLGRYGEIGTANEPKPDPAEQKQASATAAVYTCPMDPEVVSDKPGNCPKCGMALVKKAAETDPTAVASSASRWAEGYTCAMHPDLLSKEGGTCQTCGCGMKLSKWRIERILSIPETAVIDTGTRQVVYVESAPGIYDARVVTLGPRAGSYYPVLGGLASGDRIVTHGSFLIDSEARLNPASSGTAPHAGHAAAPSAPAGG